MTAIAGTLVNWGPAIAVATRLCPGGLPGLPGQLGNAVPNMDMNVMEP